LAAALAPLVGNGTYVYPADADHALITGLEIHISCEDILGPAPSRTKKADVLVDAWEHAKNFVEAGNAKAEEMKRLYPDSGKTEKARVEWLLKSWPA